MNYHYLFFQEGAFALCFKSKFFPGECVATRRGSPLLVGIKTATRLATDYVPILYGKGKIPHHFFYYSPLSLTKNSRKFTTYHCINKGSRLACNMFFFLFSIACFCMKIRLGVFSYRLWSQLLMISTHREWLTQNT